MALNARTTWEVRTGGSANNGAGFNPANSSAGTDFSQQAAQVTYTDLVIDGAVNTRVTSAINPFSSAHIGNLIHITSGTGFTTGFYEVVSLTSTAANLDRAVGTLGSTGGNGRLGGAASSLVDIQGVLVDGNTVWVQAGSGYTTSSQWAPNGATTDGRFVAILGYTTTRGDNGLATITASANLAPIVSLGAQTIFRNFKVDGANTADRGVDWGIDGYSENVWVTRCNLTGMRAQNEGTRVRRSLFTFCGASAAAGAGLDLGTGCIAEACEAHDCKQGFSSSNNTGEFFYCVSHGNTANGFYQAGDDGMRLRNCISDGNTLDGLRINDTGGGTTLEITNCLFTNNGGKALNSVTTDYSAAVSSQMAIFFQNNAFYNNSGGNYTQVPAGATDVILTADPYTNRVGGDYSLNNTAGGGALLMGAGLPGGFGLLGSGTLASTGHVDIGAVQGLAAATGGSTLDSMRSLWREYTNERNVVVVPNLTVDIYLQSGLEALNRRIRYHWTDSTTDVTLIAGTQEYVLPSDIVELVWLEWNGNEVAKTSMDQLRSRLLNWRNQKQGAPQEWFFYKNRVVLIPTPDAATVAANNHIVFRYINTPPSISTNGPEQLSSQDYRIPVYHGVAEWASAHPDSALATLRAQSFKGMFESEADTIAGQYDARQVAR